jgi:hypothetical protein
MKKLLGAVALALVMFGMSGGAEASASEPPPPPYQWDAPALWFKPFYAFTHPGGKETMTFSANPQEGRDVCAWKQRYDELGPQNCLVYPMAPDKNGNTEITFGPDGLVEFPDGPPAIEIVFG